jgi:hypothetical protein
MIELASDIKTVFKELMAEAEKASDAKFAALKTKYLEMMKNKNKISHADTYKARLIDDLRYESRKGWENVVRLQKQVRSLGGDPDEGDDGYRPGEQKGRHICFRKSKDKKKMSKDKKPLKVVKKGKAMSGKANSSGSAKAKTFEDKNKDKVEAFEGKNDPVALDEAFEDKNKDKVEAFEDKNNDKVEAFEEKNKDKAEAFQGNTKAVGETRKKLPAKHKEQFDRVIAEDLASEDAGADDVPMIGDEDPGITTTTTTTTTTRTTTTTAATTTATTTITPTTTTTTTTTTATITTTTNNNISNNNNDDNNNNTNTNNNHNNNSKNNRQQEQEQQQQSELYESLGSFNNPPPPALTLTRECLCG